jgi:hypothetical protein
VKEVAADSAFVCCDDHIVLKDVFADEVAVAVSSGYWKDRAMFNDGFLKACSELGTSGLAGCLPLRVFVNFGGLPLLEPSDGRFLGFGDGLG